MQGCIIRFTGSDLTSVAYDIHTTYVADTIVRSKNKRIESILYQPHR